MAKNLYSISITHHKWLNQLNQIPMEDQNNLKNKSNAR